MLWPPSSLRKRLIGSVQNAENEIGAAASDGPNSAVDVTSHYTKVGSVLVPKAFIASKPHWVVFVGGQLCRSRPRLSPRLVGLHLLVPSGSAPLVMSSTPRLCWRLERFSGRSGRTRRTRRRRRSATRTRSSRRQLLVPGEVP